MNETWLCLDCRRSIELDPHGRCGTCGSDAVDSAERVVRWIHPALGATETWSQVPQFAGAV